MLTLGGCVTAPPPQSLEAQAKALSAKPPKDEGPRARYSAKILEGHWFTVARPTYRNSEGVSRESFSFQKTEFLLWKVTYRGWHNESGTWLEKKLVVIETDNGNLAGTFFAQKPAPIYILATDKKSRCLLIRGANQREFLILSKDEYPDPKSIEDLITIAQANGFPVEELLFLQAR